MGVVVITGAGEKAFIAGADIGELAKLTPVDGREHALRGQAIVARLENLGKPVIAAVNGYALGGGCELALACTIRIASENARFGQPEVKLGILPGYGGSQRLARLVGKGRAMQLCLTAEQIDAAGGVADRPREQGRARGAGGGGRPRDGEGDPRQRSRGLPLRPRGDPPRPRDAPRGRARTSRPRSSASARRPRT